MQLFVALIVGAAVVIALNDDEIVRCGVGDPPEDLKLEYADAENRWSNKIQSQPFSQTINTYIHMVTTEQSKNNWTQEQIDEQVNIMNRAYNEEGFSFTLINTTWTVNDTWARFADENGMKGALRQGSYSALNIYFLSDLGSGLLGYSHFPLANFSAQDLIRDGCVNLASSLPNGGLKNYQLGATAVHEAGHWLGLFHVFEGNVCSGQGDYVSDTPAQANSTKGCPRNSIPDTCPDNPGEDNIFNWMDYSYDECLDQFTVGQGTRMRSVFMQMRQGK